MLGMQASCAAQLVLYIQLFYIVPCKSTTYPSVRRPISGKE